jgi:hypothetical protein
MKEFAPQYPVSGQFVHDGDPFVNEMMFLYIIIACFPLNVLIVFMRDGILGISCYRILKHRQVEIADESREKMAPARDPAGNVCDSFLHAV